MAMTEQRTGFRLPWASEPRREPSDDAIEPATTEDDVTHETDTATVDPRLSAWPSGDASGSPEAAESLAGESLASESFAGAATASDPTSDPASAAARNEEPTAPAPPRRTNPLVAGLVRAMRDAATVARHEATAQFTDATKLRIEAIHGEAALEATAIRYAADEDISAARDWSKAEMVRIREETETRIAGRRRRLELETGEHAARVEHRIEAVHGAVAVFGAKMDAFFDQLLAEEDPARLAGLAEQLPEPPSLEGLDDGWVAPRTLDSAGAATAEAEALAEFALDKESAANDDSAEGGAEVAVVDRLAAFTGPSARLETEATTSIAVVGLVSVAGIAGFKRALGRIRGVRGVAVASGPSGDFIFIVQHAGTTDLRTAIPDLDGFAARITGDADGALAVMATDPDVAH